jgi:hypothetical protein
MSGKPLKDAAQIRRVSASRRWPWISLLVMQVVQLMSLAPWLMMAGLSFMAFDAPGSEKMRGPWIFVIAVWSYPLWLLAADAISWVLFAFRHHKSAVVLCAIFTIPLPALVLLVLAANAIH